MPYFISNDTDCPEWAVVKDDGEVIACHDTEDSAIAQMVAVSQAEGIEPGGTYERQNRAEPDQLEVGDFVRWESSGGTAQGRIERIERDGQINVPDSSFTINGEEDDPAALIRIYQEGEEGWQATDTLVGHRFSTLTKIDPLESRELPDAYRPANSEDVPEGRACGNCMFYNEDRQNEEGLSYCERWDDFVRGDFYCDAWESDDDDDDDEIELETREVDLTPPAYMRASARRGLEWHEEGLSGDGLVDRTVREARAMAEGNVTADKWVRIRAWIARHMDDLDSPDANPDSDNFPSPGVVAMALWGGGTTKRSARRAMDYADGVVSRIEEENEGRARGEALSKFEQRVMVSDLEIRSENGMTLEGYAAVFNSRSENLGGFTEQIERGAFTQTLKARNDIKLLWNHDTSAVLGSTRAGTLELREDEKGLRVMAELPDTTLGRDISYLVKRGDIDSFSFGFSVMEDSWNSAGNERTLESVRLFEVSLVSFPAYSATAGTAVVRGLDKIAKRADVDADELADALLKVEGGEEISPEQKSLLSKVIDTLSPEEAEQQGEDFDSQAWLDLKKTKLQYLKKKA